MENIEIKARVSNLHDIREKIIKMDHKYIGLDHQVDTYFSTKSGRMKLRESKLSGSYMILYFRDDIHGPKSSTYQIIPIENSDEVKSLLSQMLGLQVIVEKERDIFLYENVRIHLDQVSGLGIFMELEAVMDKKFNDRGKETDKVNFLLDVLDINKEHLLSKSYRELVAEKY